MQELVKALASKTRDGFDDAWPDAEAELEQIFRPEVWGIHSVAEPYTDANYANIWKTEIRASIRAALEDDGLGEQDYATWLGEIHFVSVAVYRKALFEKYQSNRGWRVLILSLPAVAAGVVGLASHYQNAQNNIHLADVSGLLFDHLAAAASTAQLQLPGRKVTKHDWTDDTLFPQPITDVAGTDVSDEASGGRLFLRDVRTTTVKKILASMISIEAIDLNDASGSHLAAALSSLQAIGRLIA